MKHNNVKFCIVSENSVTLYKNNSNYTILFKDLDKEELSWNVIKMIEEELKNELKEYRFVNEIKSAEFYMVGIEDDIVRNLDFALETLKNNKNYLSIKNVLKLIME